MSVIGELTSLAKLKNYGVILAVIGLIGFLVFTIFKITTNEMEHSQAAIERNTEALGGIKGAMEGNTEVLRIIQQTLLIKGR